MDQLLEYVMVKIMNYEELRKSLDFVNEERERLEKKLIILQQRNYDLQDKILTSIELLKKGNNDKALKVLKKVIYEK